MTRKLILGKSRDSRTRGKEKDPVSQSEAEQLKTTLQEVEIGFINYLLEKGYSSRTIQQYSRDIANFTRWLTQENVEPLQATNRDILHYIQTKKKTVNQHTISTTVNSLKHYYNYHIKAEAITENPAIHIKIRGVKRKQLYHILTKPELETLYHNYKPAPCRHPENHLRSKAHAPTIQRDKIILGLLIYQGLNAKDLISLKEKDLKLREGKIEVAGSRRSNPRTLKLEAVQIMDLIEYQSQTRPKLLELFHKQSEQLLVSSGEGHNLHNTLQRFIKDLKKQNSKVDSLNQIRTSVITHWLKLYNLRQVQYMAGHRFVSSTEGYLINDLDDLQEDISKFHPIG